MTERDTDQMVLTVRDKVTADKLTVVLPETGSIRDHQAELDELVNDVVEAQMISRDDAARAVEPEAHPLDDFDPDKLVVGQLRADELEVRSVPMWELVSPPSDRVDDMTSTHEAAEAETAPATTKPSGGMIALHAGLAVVGLALLGLVLGLISQGGELIGTDNASAGVVGIVSFLLGGFLLGYGINYIAQRR